MTTLRPYQETATDAIMRELMVNDSTLLVIPTGGGKTVVFSEVIRRLQPARVMVLAHREELIMQARAKIIFGTGLDCEVEMAHMAARKDWFTDCPVIVSTIQTQIAGRDGGRMTRFSPHDFSLLIIDEAHRATSASYRKVIAYYQQNPFLKLLGVTATPDRADEAALGEIFKTVAFDYEILDAINDGWLVPIKQQMVHVHGLDYSAVKIQGHDLNGGQLAAIMEAEENMQKVASASIEIIGTKRALVFTVSVKQAEMLSEIFNRHRQGMSQWVSGETDKDVRREILKDFSTGQTQVVVNCNCLSEGYDNPTVEVVVMARPTKSRCLYAQMCGRGTRSLPGVIDVAGQTADCRKAAIAASKKPHLLIVDFAGNSGKHSLCSTADILGGKSSKEAIAKAKEMAEKKGGACNMVEMIASAEEEIRKQKEAAEARRQAEVARKARLVAKAKYTTTNINPFNAFDLTPVSPRGWDNNHNVSIKERDILLRQGINPEGMPYHQAKQLLGETFRRWNKKLCSLKQAAKLKTFGYATKDMTFKDANALLDRIAKNHWKRPPEDGPNPNHSPKPPTNNPDEPPF